MEHETPLQKKLYDLDNRLQKAMKDCVPVMDEVRNISQNQEEDMPTSKEDTLKIYEERMRVFDCMDDGKELPEMISDKCLIQLMLMLEMMMCTLIQEIYEKYKNRKVEYVNLTPRAYRRKMDKMDEKLLRESIPDVEKLEYFSETIIMFYEIYKEDYPEIYSKYNYSPS